MHTFIWVNSKDSIDSLDNLPDAAIEKRLNRKVDAYDLIGHMDMLKIFTSAAGYADMPAPNVQHKDIMWQCRAVSIAPFVLILTNVDCEFSKN
jgi:hypothetical protein